MNNSFKYTGIHPFTQGGYFERKKNKNQTRYMLKPGWERRIYLHDGKCACRGKSLASSGAKVWGISAAGQRWARSPLPLTGRTQQHTSSISLQENKHNLLKVILYILDHCLSLSRSRYRKSESRAATFTSY